MQSKRILGDTLEIPNYLQTENWSEETNFDQSEWDDARLFIDGIIRQSKVNFAELSLMGDW